jgi:hypothetical protein
MGRAPTLAMIFAELTPAGDRAPVEPASRPRARPRREQDPGAEPGRTTFVHAKPHLQRAYWGSLYSFEIGVE